MSERWLEISLSVPDQAVDLVCQTLTELGSTGVTAAERTLDTFIVPPPEALANDPQLRAYFPYPEDIDALCTTVHDALLALAKIYPGLKSVSMHHRELADHDWASDWQQNFPPFRVGDRLVIKPSWIEWESSGNECVITLDPGQAFGTGTHATTSLCLDAVAAHFATAQAPRTVLDVGTGSGILAMAAAALGARVVACDIDPTACRVAAENVGLNDLAGAIDISTTPLQEISGRFDLVLANILAAENIRLAQELVEHTKGGGRLVLSGILIEQEQQVSDGFSMYPLTLLERAHRDGWTCIVYRREARQLP
jgi:ribosomal protein L11 methyltransferase